MTFSGYVPFSLWHCWGFKTGTLPSISGANELWVSVCTCVCVCASTHKIVLSILFLTSFLMMLAFVAATILWTDFFREWSPMMPSSFSCITSALGALGLPRTRWALFSCGHYVQQPPLSVNVLCLLAQLCELFLMFILVRLIFQLPEKSWWHWSIWNLTLNHFWKMVSKTGAHRVSWNIWFFKYILRWNNDSL